MKFELKNTLPDEFNKLIADYKSGNLTDAIFEQIITSSKNLFIVADDVAYLNQDEIDKYTKQIVEQKKVNFVKTAGIISKDIDANYESWAKFVPGILPFDELAKCVGCDRGAKLWAACQKIAEYLIANPQLDLDKLPENVTVTQITKDYLKKGTIVEPIVNINELKGFVKSITHSDKPINVPVAAKPVNVVKTEKPNGLVMKSMECWDCALKHISAAEGYAKEVRSGHSIGAELDHRSDMMGEIVNAEHHLKSLLVDDIYLMLKELRQKLKAKRYVADESDIQVLRKAWNSVEKEFYEQSLTLNKTVPTVQQPKITLDENGMPCSDCGKPRQVEKNTIQPVIEKNVPVVKTTNTADVK